MWKEFDKSYDYHWKAVVEETKKKDTIFDIEFEMLDSCSWSINEFELSGGYTYSA